MCYMVDIHTSLLFSLTLNVVCPFIEKEPANTLAHLIRQIFGIKTCNKPTRTFIHQYNNNTIYTYTTIQFI